MADEHSKYMKRLHEWQKACNFHYAMCWNYYGMQLMHANHIQFASAIPVTPTTAPSSSTRVTQPSTQQRPPPLSQHREYKIAPLYQRVLAEFVDFFVLMGIKMLVILLLIKLMGFNTRNMTFDIIWNDDMWNVEGSAEDFQFMIGLTFLYRMVACLYEALFISMKGATPGKKLFGLKVISCQACFSVQRGSHQYISVYPAINTGFTNSLVRSLIKNFSIAFLMPAFLTVFFYQHNRASYDIVSNTIVVKSR